MLKRWLGAAALLGAVMAPRPAAAQTFDPYWSLYQARTTLASPTDDRPKDALVAVPSRKENARERFLVQPYLQRGDATGGGDSFGYGLALGYANTTDSRHPWQIAGAFQTNHFDVPGRNFDQPTWWAEAKYTLWQGARKDLPVVSLVADYFDYYARGHQFDILLAADQRVSDKLYLSINAGYADFSRGASGLAAGIGATYSVMPKLSFSTAYNFNGPWYGEDYWTLAGTYAFNGQSSLMVGGGKHGLVFGQFAVKFDR